MDLIEEEGEQEGEDGSTDETVDGENELEAVKFPTI